jgi:GalNAc-alpha-(1->4)-GalNAc-alpha-(1->3)-diNAcBac-PP-undecaprenol alpha-1,4-N-acetyl-D-galactosaminyltransferase
MKILRVTFVIASLESGGAARVMTVMANYWAERGVDVTIVTLSPQASDWYKLHPCVKRVELGLVTSSADIVQAIRNNVRRVCALRQTLRLLQPQAVISFLDTTNVVTLLAGWGLGIPLIVSERTDPRKHRIGTAWNWLRSLLYRRADAIVVQSNAVRDWAIGQFGSTTVHLIPNPLNPDLNKPEMVAGHRELGRTVVAMGRLGREKGFDLLIEAFARCAAKHPDWSLVILGEGQERRALEVLSAELRIAHRVWLVGQIHSPTASLKRADLFVLSSRYEGFPNALLEAMACGMAVIATDCPSGPQEIIRNGVDGVLVKAESIEALASAMDGLMADGAARTRLGARAVEVVERFSPSAIMNKWEEVLHSVCRRSHVEGGVGVDGSCEPVAQTGAEKASL